MSIVYIVLAIIISLMLIASGAAKLRRVPNIIQSLHEVAGVPLNWLPWLALLEFAGAAGLLIGIFWRPLGIAAAIGIVLYFIGASITHIRVKDYKGLPAPLVLLLIAIATLVISRLTLS